MARRWTGYYRWTANRPPRELLLRTLEHIGWETSTNRPGRRTAIELGFGAGTDTLELLRRGWRVLAIDAQKAAERFLRKRVPARLRPALTVRVASMEDVDLPPADLVYAGYSLPFCPPERFARLWRGIRESLRPRGHFAGQLFGDRDEWYGERPMTFHDRRAVRALTRGLRVELFRETEEEGRSYEGPKHWHVFDLIVERPR